MLNDFQLKWKQGNEGMISLLTSLKICLKDLWSFDRQIYLIVKAIEHCWLEQRKAGQWGEDQAGQPLAASCWSPQQRSIFHTRLCPRVGWSRRHWYLDKIEQLNELRNTPINYSLQPLNLNILKVSWGPARGGRLTSLERCFAFF